MRGIPGSMKRKVWFALATATLVAAPLLHGPLPSAARPQGHPILVVQAGEGGERSIAMADRQPRIPMFQGTCCATSTSSAAICSLPTS